MSKMTRRCQIMPKTKTQKKPQLIRKDQVTGETSWKDDSSQNWFTWWAALSAGMVFMGGRRTGGYSLEDYCGIVHFFYT